MAGSTSLIPTVPLHQLFLKWTRRAWLLLAGFLFVVFLIAIPSTYQMLLTPCRLGEVDDCASWAQPTSQTMAALENSGIPLPTAALYFLGLYVGASAVFWVVGLLIYHYRPDQWFALLVAHLLILLGTGGVSLVFISGLEFSSLPDVIGMIVGLLTIPMYQFLSLFFLTFPNGRFYGRWSVIPFILICLNTFVWVVPSPVLNIQYWTAAAAGTWLALVYGSHLVAQIIRYRRMYTAVERQQTKWLIYSFSLPLVLFQVIGILQGDSSSADLHPILNGTLVALLYLPVGVSIGIAILRYRLWDIDSLINRTLVYGALTALLVGLYALIVGTLSQLVHDDGNFVVSLLGAGVIAVMFQPLHRWIQTAINRLMFGQRDEPVAVMDELRKRLEAILSPEAALQQVVETTARALKLPYVAIECPDRPGCPAYGVPPAAEPARFPLVYQAQIIGALLAAPRSPSETLNAADRLVLENIAQQASNLVHTSRLTDDLQRSRQEILTTREEERRRLRRDLHDGLGPALATLTSQAEAAREWLHQNPQRSEALLTEIIQGTQSTLAEIRRIVYALRPPVLDELGLVSAIREQAARYSSDDLVVLVEAPDCLPVLPAATEVAVYRIVQEALTNVHRHARARCCRVCLSINGKLDVEIVDDGIGLPIPYRSGVGLHSIHERAAELGGSCAIQSQQGDGTQIRVSLPRE